MPCFKPLNAFQSVQANALGKRSINFDGGKGYQGRGSVPIQLPCGQCIGCRLEYSRQWAVRIVHEMSLHPTNCFITLTYDDDHLPANYSLDVGEFQRFMKRFREKVRHVNPNIRFYHCGEYGEKTLRPHYHAIIFGYDFPDKVRGNLSASNPLYVSQELCDLWPYGFSSIGEANFETAAYCARYITKKINGERADSHYERVLDTTGEIFSVVPEYSTMSRRPGVGKGWYGKYQSDVFPVDRVVIRGKEMKPPRAYMTYLEAENHELYLKIKESRKNKLNSVDKSFEEQLESVRRLPVREEFAKLRQATFSPRNKEF